MRFYRFNLVVHADDAAGKLRRFEADEVVREDAILRGCLDVMIRLGKVSEVGPPPVAMVAAEPPKEPEIATPPEPESKGGKGKKKS